MNINKIVAECDPLQLPNASFKGRTKTFPSVSGIYFIYKDLELLYIGQSTDIKNRFVGYHQVASSYTREKAGEIQLFWLELPCNKDILDEAERRFIIRYKPPFNFVARNSNKIMQSWMEKLQEQTTSHTILSVRAVKAMEEQTHSVQAVEAVVDRRVSTAELQTRYGLKSRTTLLTRIKELGIKTYKEGNLVYVPEKSLQALDALHECLKNPKAKLEGCVAEVKNQMHNGSSPTVENAIAQPSSTNTILLQLPSELIETLRTFLEQPSNNWNDYEQLELIASKGWAIATSRLLPLLGRKSIPKLDHHNRFSCMGFVFLRVGKIGNQYQWKITKIQ